MEAEALVDKLEDWLAEVKAKRIVQKLGDEDAGTLVDTLAETTAEADTKTVGETLGDMEAKHWLTLLQKRWPRRMASSGTFGGRGTYRPVC